MFILVHGPILNHGFDLNLLCDFRTVWLVVLLRVQFMTNVVKSRMIVV